MPKFRAFSTFCAIAVSAFGATSSFATPGASNAQLMTLLGDDPLIAATDEPGPTQRMVECIQLLSGVDNEIFKDAPKELLGQIGIDCRRMLKERMQDSKLNPMGFTVEDFENPQLARQVLTAAQARDVRKRLAAAKRDDDMRRQQADAEKRAAEARAAQEKLRQDEDHARVERLQKFVLGVWRGDLSCFGNMTALTLKLTRVDANGIVDGELEGASVAGRNKDSFRTPPFAVTGNLASPQEASEGGSSMISVNPKQRVAGPFRSFHMGVGGRMNVAKGEISGTPFGAGSCPLSLKRAGGL